MFLLLMFIGGLTVEASPFAHADWQAVLDAYRTTTARVNYEKLNSTGALDGYITSLETAVVPADVNAKMAFWINAYNALTVDLIADTWPVKTIQDIDGGQVWRTRRFIVAGEKLTLDEIEKQKLSARQEPRIHFVLNCASVGCPPLNATAFSGEELNRQLNFAAKSWLPDAGVFIDREAKTLTLSTIFHWYAPDFTDTDTEEIAGVDVRLQASIKYAAQYLPEHDQEWLRAGGYDIQFKPFDWAVNATQ